MTSVPDVTVLVPSYNHAPFIERTLRSIFAQVRAPKKLIVIDDGSKDESVPIIERVLKDCPFDHEFIARQNRGLCATLNQGLDLSDTDFFAYISSDDLWLPEFLQSRLAALETRSGAVLSYGYSYIIDENDRVTDTTRNWAQYSDGKALEMLLYPVIPASAAVVYRRAPLEECRWNEESSLEDYELYLRLSARGDFALDERELSAWRIHGYNTSANFGLMMEEWIAAQDRNYAEIGLSESELRIAQSRLKFRCVKDFLRRGDRRTAWKLFKENSRESGSLLNLAATLIRFAVPTPLFSRIKAGKAGPQLIAPR